ncbi:hypothetical protein MLD38_027890 [Melastoma candidum]|uniref:Uncharacterized protein n=1 Tax=Melastoma candidum TaxID=119954 RepID=A0ACB9N1M2_9MYRT|nr:hypothetical protein MLD38_027890 [Melastoma candidum]
MEGSGSSASDHPSSSPPPSPSASKLLTNLPSRGLFSSSTVVSSNPGGMRVYVCEHETAPPEDQVIRTNQQNILIRSLMIKKQRGDSISKSGKGTTVAEGSRKRASERLSDAASAKRPNTQGGSQQEGSHSHLSDKDLHTLTVERLRALLKEKGLSAKGKKDELIARLKG